MLEVIFNLFAKYALLLILARILPQQYDLVVTIEMMEHINQMKENSNTEFVQIYKYDNFYFFAR
jgi:2-polyprenyl-3-methyl-5-hydroxy-6-metoxy-1,4-benzoquinol methylase